MHPPGRHGAGPAGRFTYSPGEQAMAEYAFISTLVAVVLVASFVALTGGIATLLALFPL